MHGPRHLPWHTYHASLQKSVRHKGWLSEVTVSCLVYTDPLNKEVDPESLEAVTISRDGDETTCSLTEAAQWVESQWAEWDYEDV